MKDVFIEKLVTRKKTALDYLFFGGIVAGAILLMLFVVPLIPVLRNIPIITAGAIIYGVYYLIRSRRLEFEYAVTNGDLDVDMIIDQRKRKRLFSGHCNEFEIVAPVSHERLGHYASNVKKKIPAVSSMDSPDVYFIVADYNNERVMVFFEPDERMLENFKKYIPRKVFTN